MSTSPSPQRPEGFAGRLKSFRNPTRAFTLSPPRPASPSTTTSGPGGRPTPTRSSTRDASTPPVSRRASMIPSAFQRKTSTKASSSKAPSSEAVNELGAKTTEPATVAEPEGTTERPSTEAPKEDTSADVSGHTRAISGSTVETDPPMTPPPTQTAEPMTIPKSEDPMSDSPHDGASIASSRSPSRLRRQVSNLSRHSVSGSIRRLSLLGPASPPQVETSSVHAQGEMQKSLSRSPSTSSLRRHAASPEPVSTKPATPEPTSEVEAPKPAPETEAPQPAPVVEAPQPAPQPETIPEVPQAEAAPAETEAPKPAAQPEVQPAVVSTPKEVTPAPSVKAPSDASAPKPAEPKTPVKPLMSRSASRSSLTKSPTPDKPEPKRRSTLANWARKSLDRRPSVSGSPGPSTPNLVRPASRGPVDDDSDTGSVKERERKWGTGLPVPNPPTPKKSEDNLKRRFSLGRRPTDTKSPNESSSDAEKKPNWGSKMLRAVGKSKKEKEKGDGSSITPEASSVDVTSASEPESRPSLMIPDRVYGDQRPLSAIVESPVVPLNPHMLAGMAGPAQSPEQVMGAPLPAVSSDSPVVVKAETTSPEMSPVLLDLDSDNSALGSGAENPPTFATVAAEIQPTEAVVVEEPESVEVEQPKDDAPTTEETPAVEEAAVPEAETSTPAAEATATPAPAANLLSPMSPNSPASTPWDPTAEREIARARSPRQSNGGPSNRRGSPAPSIIGVKRKHPDEPTTEVGKARVRYLPGECDSEPERNTVSLNVDGRVDWAVSPAIQLAVTLSLVLPRRKRDIANPANRKRGGWWPLRRGTRTEMRHNAIRGVNEEVPIASKSWVVPAAVRTTAKVVTAPARRGDIEWGPVDETDDDDTENEPPSRLEFSLSPSPEPDLECR